MNSIEELFVRTFVKKRLQERIIFELSSLKNRQKAIDRFSHNAEEVLESKYILAKSEKITITEIENELLKYCDKNKEVYMFSMNEYDGKMVFVKEAVENCMKEFMPVIITCGGDKFAFVKTEVSGGSSMKYFLKKY